MKVDVLKKQAFEMTLQEWAYPEELVSTIPSEFRPMQKVEGKYFGVPFEGVFMLSKRETTFGQYIPEERVFIRLSKSIVYDGEKRNDLLLKVDAQTGKGKLNTFIRGWGFPHKDHLVAHKLAVKQAISEGKIISHSDYPELGESKRIVLEKIPKINTNWYNDKAQSIIWNKVKSLMENN